MPAPKLNINDFTYQLDEDRIAKYPLAQRDASKLLVYRDGQIRESAFANLSEHLPYTTLMVFNNTRVVQARLLFSRGEGLRPIEIFCLEPAETDLATAMAEKKSMIFNCLVGGAKKWKEGVVLKMAVQNFSLQARMLGRNEAGFQIKFDWDGEKPFAEILEEAGKTPIPPYLKRSSEDSDKIRYQTVYARLNGSVAAPTAGLHFTPAVFQSLKEKNITTTEVTLHVGAGTFKPVSSENVADHQMHAEEAWVNLETIKTLIEFGGKLTAVGTTAVRTLESLYWLAVQLRISGALPREVDQWAATDLPQEISAMEALALLRDFMESEKIYDLRFHTRLMIHPGYRFNFVEAVVTNFHQPGSTLILLVAAALGNDWREVYNFALSHDFRFLSYGDSSLLFLNPAAKA